MKITNKFELPSGFVNIAKDQREIKPKNYSVTTILSSTRQILLGRRYDNELEEDVSNMVNVIFGTAIHHVLEMADKENITEKQLTFEIQDGYVLSGKFDLYNEKTATIEDYKSTTVYKIKSQNFEDWEKQGLMYAWLAMKHGYIVEHLKFHALLKDWKASGAKYDNSYPKQQIYTWKYNITSKSLIEIEEFIRARFKEIIYYEDKELLPMCSEEERWRSPAVYAVMKKGRKSAMKLCNTLEEANTYLTNDNISIETRLGEDKKCEGYCNVKVYCDYWRNKHGI